jgi:hypothetical protein
MSEQYAEDGVRSEIDAANDPWAMPPTAVSWDVEPPFTVTGRIVKQEMAQQLKFDDKKPDYWDDGRPKRKVIVTLESKPADDDPTDDGLRSIHAKIPSALYASIRDAIREANLRTLPVNGTHYLAITYTKDTDQTPAEIRSKRSPAKEFVSLISDQDLSEAPF